jgi:hypothetical protein
MQITLIGILIAPAMNLDFDFLRQLAAQVFNVNACAAVDVRRILSSHQTNAHAGLLRRTFILARAQQAPSGSAGEALLAGDAAPSWFGGEHRFTAVEKTGRQATRSSSIHGGRNESIQQPSNFLVGTV